MTLPSIFILLFASFLSVLQPSLTDIVDPGIQLDVPEDLDATQFFLQSQKLRDLANELALDYIYDGDTDEFSNLAKRDPGSDSVEKKGTEPIYDEFERRGLQPRLIKLTYGKRSDDKRYNNPFFFGKREDVNDLDKRGYSPFMFGKREMEDPQFSEKRGRLSSFMFGKRGDADEDKRRLSALYFGKRVPELAKRRLSKLYFGKRGGHLSKFMFGKREDDDLETEAVENRMTDKRGDDKRLPSSFYYGKRNYGNEDMENLQDV